ncbi:MAG: leucyl aminopeptidase [Bacteroidales bacterium]|nr:leucyl aminopeptidase [Bacteroidales bacterium]
MLPTITLTNKEQELGNLVIPVSRLSKIPAGIFTTSEKGYLKKQIDDFKQDVVSFNRLNYWVYLFYIKPEPDRFKRLESCRKGGCQIAGLLHQQKADKVTVFDPEGNNEEVMAFAEGLSLGCYCFLKYKTDKDEENKLREIELYSSNPPSAIHITHLNILLEAVSRCRDLINEPNSHLTANGFARAVEKMAKESGAGVEVFHQQKIEALKMGGLLGVNQGSKEPPTFTVMEWKPENAKNKKPYLFVGKGIIYDTGGMNLKPGDFMLNMKDDMSGAAAVASVIYAIARAKLPVYVVGLMPATDNRPGAEALVSGDIITMHNGTTVEVLNTDAEGRLILADALSYASKFDPALVIDLATLTGAALRAIGKFGAAAMQSQAVNELEALKFSGFMVYERLVEFPLWDDYGEQIKSDLADLKNTGSSDAGMITAGKFLQKFTAYPYIHLDIAGPAFLEKPDSYRGQGGTGFGVRLLFDFIKSYCVAAKV